VSGPRSFPPVAIAGIGIVSAAGRGPAATLRALVSGGAPPSAPRTIHSELAARYPVFEVPDEAFDAPPVRLPGGRGRRGVRLALLAAGDALADARVVGLLPERIAVVVGGTVGGMNHTEDWVEEQVRGAPAVPGRSVGRGAVRHLPLAESASTIAATFGLGGPSLAVSTACTSGSQAIACAADLLATGVADAVLAGGVDALSRLTYHGFASLMLLSERRCTPFDLRRSGLNLGEGGAFLLLVPADRAPGAGAWLKGWSSTADAHHPTAPHPEGRGAAEAMRRAMAGAGWSAGDVDWIHAHGTGTPLNDAAESAAIRAATGGAPVPVSSTKHVFGHTLGGAGAIAAAVAVIAIREGLVPGNAPVTEPDPACGVALVPPGGRRGPVGNVLVNALGFGGTNVSLALSGRAP
jgi:3-oxoacyl-(acyl-carrier-protein) synthase